jgi:hypothetical protein
MTVYRRRDLSGTPGDARAVVGHDHRCIGDARFAERGPSVAKIGHVRTLGTLGAVCLRRHDRDRLAEDGILCPCDFIAAHQDAQGSLTKARSERPASRLVSSQEVHGRQTRGRHAGTCAYRRRSVELHLRASMV